MTDNIIAVLLALNLIALWWFMARVYRRLRSIDSNVMRARIHSEYARDNAGRVMTHLMPGQVEWDRRYGGDPPYLHTIPENKPPWYFDDKIDYRLRND